MLEKPASLKTVQYGTQSTGRPAAENPAKNSAAVWNMTSFSSIDKTVTWAAKVINSSAATAVERIGLPLK